YSTARRTAAERGAGPCGEADRRPVWAGTRRSPGGPCGPAAPWRSAFGYRHLVGALATAARADAVTVDYRLAPEHPHPAAVHDAMNAYLWLIDTGTHPDTITVVGDSAGGGLALAGLMAVGGPRIPRPAAARLVLPAGG